MWKRLDKEGVPLIIAGWPCDGDSAQNARGQGKEGLSHPSTSTLILIAKMRRAVVGYLGTPRKESRPYDAAIAQMTHNP